MIQPIWSATSCDYPGAGLYVGLAPKLEHLVVCRILSSKQLRVISGSVARFGTNETACPLNYYGIRDPSVVRVIPVKRPPLSNGFKHVRLAYKLQDGPQLQQAEQGARSELENAVGEPAAFLMTIGLPAADEDRFYEKVIGSHGEQDLSELYSRILELCGPGK